MEFYVIYSADVHDPDYLQYCRPRPALCEKLMLTEDGESEYTYLEGVWETAVHEKWVGVLTRPEFDQFISDTYLSAEDTETMGSITLDMGHIPAISFNADDQDSICNAYVTPLIPGKGTMTEAQWERLRDAVVRTYSD